MWKWNVDIIIFILFLSFCLLDYKSEKSNPMKREKNSSYNENGRSVEPCYYNSSIYYGGQEVYSPTTTNTPPHNVSFFSKYS